MPFVNVETVERRDGCSTVYVNKYVDAEGRSFEYQWTRWTGAEYHGFPLTLPDFENYVIRLHGDFRWATANNWNRFMDNHAGMYIHDCEPVIKVLEQRKVGYFFTRHFFGFIALIFKDKTGIVYELDCHKFDRGLERYAFYPNWNFCEYTPPRIAPRYSPLDDCFKKEFL